MGLRLRVFAASSALAFAACSSGGSSGTGAVTPARGDTLKRHGTSNPITHVVVMIQENRSFDNLFATYPGADGATQGLMKTPSGGEEYVPLEAVNLAEICDFGHRRDGFLKEYDNGMMDGFGLEAGGGRCRGPAGTKVYQYVNPSQIAPYWDIAEPVRASRSHVPDARERKLYRASRFNRRRHDDQRAADQKPGRLSQRHAVGMRRSQTTPRPRRLSGLASN